MKGKIRNYLLGIYDLFLAFGAIYLGVAMIRSNSGIFTEYPKEWLAKVPFTGWVMPGIIAIAIYGLGNLVAAIFSFVSINNKPWMVSSIMGGIFLISLAAQVIILKDWYMATVQFFLCSILQLGMSGYVFLGCRKNQIMRTKMI